MQHTFREQHFREAILNRYPNIPLDVLDRIVNREAMRPSNRALHSESYTPLAIASVAGFIRHNLTQYDTLLSRYMRHIARDKVRPQVNHYIVLWSAR